MNPKTDSRPFHAREKPRIAICFATVCGLGYIPLGPGTWGSLAGLAVYSLLYRLVGAQTHNIHLNGIYAVVTSAHVALLMGIALASVGLWTAGLIANFSASKDPQFVVIDEVSGQFCTYLFAQAASNWKYLLLGFILFRVFDIWKPFPVREAESLPGGWGIMADDWMAAVYAGFGLWIARALGL